MHTYVLHITYKSLQPRCCHHTTYTHTIKDITYTYIYTHTTYTHSHDIQGTAATLLPPHYICHRCQTPGHWIKDCPNDDVFLTFGASNGGICDERVWPVKNELTSSGVTGGGGGVSSSPSLVHTTSLPLVVSNSVTVTNVQVSIHACAYMHIYDIYLYVYLYVCIPIYIPTCMYIYISTCIYIY